MSWNKYRFTSLKEFRAVQDLAMANGCETMGDFEAFLEANYSHLKK